MNRLQFSGKFALPAALAILGCWLSLPPLLWTGPAFDCAKFEPGSIEEMICSDDELAALDRKLTEVYTAALKKAIRAVGSRDETTAGRTVTSANALMTPIACVSRNYRPDSSGWSQATVLSPITARKSQVKK